MNIPMYLVLTMPRNGGHGPWPVVILATQDAKLAVRTAREVYLLGYDIDLHEDGVRIDKINTDIVYHRDQHRDRGLMVYFRDERDEYFYDRDLARIHQVPVADQEPSGPLPTV